jgi:hypothetical protein
MDIEEGVWHTLSPDAFPDVHAATELSATS